MAQYYLMSILVGIFWGFLGALLCGSGFGKNIFGGLIASPFVGLFMGYLSRKFIRLNVGIRIFFSLIVLYLAVAMFAVGIGMFDVLTWSAPSQPAGVMVSRSGIAVVLQAIFAVMWGLTFLGFVFFLWPSAYLTCWFLQRYLPSMQEQINAPNTSSRSKVIQILLLCGIILMIGGIIALKTPLFSRGSMSKNSEPIAGQQINNLIQAEPKKDIEIRWESVNQLEVSKELFLLSSSNTVNLDQIFIYRTSGDQICGGEPRPSYLSHPLMEKRVNQHGVFTIGGKVWIWSNNLLRTLIVETIELSSPYQRAARIKTRMVSEVPYQRPDQERFSIALISLVPFPEKQNWELPPITEGIKTFALAEAKKRYWEIRNNSNELDPDAPEPTIEKMGVNYFKSAGFDYLVVEFYAGEGGDPYCNHMLAYKKTDTAWERIYDDERSDGRPSGYNKSLFLDLDDDGIPEIMDRSMHDGTWLMSFRTPTEGIHESDCWLATN